MDIKDCFEERFLMSSEESKKKYEEYTKQVLENLAPKFVRKNKIPKLNYLPIPEAEEQERIGERNYDDEMVNTALDAVIEAARDKGKWIILDECANEGVYCSECHKKVFKLEFSPTMKWRNFKYCPNCGARMVESEGKNDK